MNPAPDDCTQSLDLVRKAQAGDPEALNDLLERYYERVHGVVRKRLGGNMRHHLESTDILQDTFIAAVRAFDRFEMRDEASLIQWLSKIAERRIRNAAAFFGAQKRSPGNVLALDPGAEGDALNTTSQEPQADDSPVDELARREEIEIIDTCLDNLRASYRQVIVLHDYEGKSWEAVARKIGAVSPNAARMLYARAMTELANQVRAAQRP
jgi:RNA polymerase sigma-70 factor (subfamily 1)